MCCPHYAYERTVFIDCLQEFSSIEFTPDTPLFNTLMQSDLHLCKLLF